MCHVHTGAFVSLLAPGETDYTACHPRKTTTYILHVVSISTHTRDRRKSIKEKIESKKKKERKEQKTKQTKTKNERIGNIRKEKDEISKQRRDK